MPDFLLEIGCEEIPARMIDAASQELRERVAALIRQAKPCADFGESPGDPASNDAAGAGEDHLASGKFIAPLKSRHGILP